MMARGRLIAVLTSLVLLAGCAGVPGTNDMASGGDSQAPGASARNLGLVEHALREDRLDDARVILERLGMQAPDDPRVRLLEAELRLAAGDPTDAAKRFDALTDSAAVAARAHQGRGIALLKTGDEDMAHAALRRATDLDPSLGRAWNALGVYHDDRRAWAAAETAYRTALKHDPDSTAFKNNLGFSYLQQGRLGEAAGLFRDVLGAEPGHELAKTNLRLTLAAQGAYDEADRGVPADRLPEVLNDIGYVALMRGDYAVAEGYFHRAMEADPAYNRKAAANLKYLKEARASARTGE